MNVFGLFSVAVAGLDLYECSRLAWPVEEVDLSAAIQHDSGALFGVTAWVCGPVSAAQPPEKPALAGFGRLG